jgi:hypothetical protein
MPEEFTARKLKQRTLSKTELGARSCSQFSFALLLSLLLNSLNVPQAQASDWVEDGQTNFRIKPPPTNKTLAPGHSSDVDLSTQSDAASPQHQSQGSHPIMHATPYGWAPGNHPEGPEVEVRDDGAGRSSRPSNKEPLEGYMSDGGITPGLSEDTERRMAAAPRIPQADARNVGAAVFRNWLEKNYGKVGVIPKGSIIDVKGQWDDSSHILHSLGLGCDKIAPNQLTKTNLDKTAVIVVDCAGALNPDAIEIVRNFVLNGGYLVTTDWALDGTLARLTSVDETGFISWNSGYSYPETVDAIVVDPIEVLIKGCVPYARWRLDDKCQTVHVRDASLHKDKYTGRIDDTRTVHVLVRSNQLAKSDPDNKGILAATFQMGKGRILHIVGHFDNNTGLAFNTTLPDAEPTMGISLRQGITTNFIMNGLKKHGLLDAPAGHN